MYYMVKQRVYFSGLHSHSTGVSTEASSRATLRWQVGLASTHSCSREVAARFGKPFPATGAEGPFIFTSALGDLPAVQGH